MIATLACRWPVSRQLTVCCWDKDPVAHPGPRPPWSLRAILQIEERGRSRSGPEPGGHERFGIACAQVADLLALAGDSADSLPGVSGIGKKTAAQLLTAHGSLWAIYRALDEDRLDRPACDRGARQGTAAQPPRHCDLDPPAGQPAARRGDSASRPDRL